MGDKKTVVLIEQLNIITFVAYVLFFKNRVESTIYVNTSRWFNLLIQILAKLNIKILENLHQIYYYEYPGSWYEQVEETGLYVNEKLFEKYSNNIYVSPVIKFGKTPLYSLAIKKELYNRYTFERVKTHIFLIRLSETYDYVNFLPVDSENIMDLLSARQQHVSNYAIPKKYAFFLNFSDSINKIFSVFAYPFTLCYIAVRFLFNGISVTTPKKKTYNFGIDTYGMGIPWKVPYHSFFIYNKTDFHPSKVLTVLRSPLSDEKTKLKFEKYNIPYAIWNKQKTPLRFFLSRVFADLSFRQMKNFIVGFFTFNKKSFFFLPCLAVSKMIIEAQIFYYYYDIKVFIARDDYSSRHIIRTLVAQENNASTTGFMHGDYTIPGTESITDLYFDSYAIYGDFYPTIHEKGLSRCNPEVIGAGMYGLDKTFELAQKGYVPEKYRELKKSYKILLIIGGPFMDETESCFTKDLMIKYYNDILNLTDEYKDYFRIIKSPPGEDRLDLELNDIISRHERVIIDKDLWTYKIILLSDLTLCYASCTVGLESIMAGKKITFYDVYKYKNHAYKKYSPYLVAQTFEDLQRNLDFFLKEKKSLDPITLDTIRKEHGFRFDGRVVHRFRQLCRNLIRSKNQYKKTDTPP